MSYGRMELGKWGEGAFPLPFFPLPFIHEFSHLSICMSVHESGLLPKRSQSIHESTTHAPTHVPIHSFTIT